MDNLNLNKILDREKIYSDIKDILIQGAKKAKDVAATTYAPLNKPNKTPARLENANKRTNNLKIASNFDILNCLFYFV